MKKMNTTKTQFHCVKVCILNFLHDNMKHNKQKTKFVNTISPQADKNQK